jgi:hypothetical protein
MTQAMINLLVLGTAIVCAGILAGGVYIGIQGNDGSSYIINRFTGAAYFCRALDCQRARFP